MTMKKNHSKQIGNIIGISITLIIFIIAGLYVINDNITDHTLIRQENLKKDDIMLNDLTTIVNTVKATFATYKDDTASVMDHAQLMLMGTSENKKRYLAVRQAKDYKVAASALQAAGYATDTEYAPKLVNLIETYHLDKYDPKPAN